MPLSIIILASATICPPIGLILAVLGLKNDFKNWKRYIVCISIFVGALAYNFYPSYENDLQRYEMRAEILKYFPLNEAISNISYGKSGLWLYNLMCWVAVKGNDFHIIPALNTFCVYLIFLYITFSVGIDIGVSRKYIILYSLLGGLALDFYAITNNIRNISTFALISLAIYRDIYQNKKNIITILLYILPIFIHTSAILLVCLRCLLWFKIFQKPLVIISLISLSQIILKYIDVIIKVLQVNPLFIILINMLTKADNYLNESDGSEERLTVFKLCTRIPYLLFAILLLIQTLRAHNVLKNNERLKIYVSYLIFILAITLLFGFTTYLSMYWRFEAVAIIIGSISYMTLSNINRNTNKLVNSFTFLIVGVCPFFWGFHLIKTCNYVNMLLSAFSSGPAIIITKYILNCTY